jgi:hypothetical protein
MYRRVVFGTLLGPETTGPWHGCVLRFVRGPVVVWVLCFWFPGCTDRTVVPLFLGVVCGVCGTGLLFENYIVDASIFYKKQFPRKFEPGSVVPSSGGAVVFVVLSELLLDLLWSSF